MNASSAVVPASAAFRLSMSARTSSWPTYLIGPAQTSAFGRTVRLATSAPERAACMIFRSS